MTIFKFTDRVGDVEDFLRNELNPDLIIPHGDPDQDAVTYFQNGDKLAINVNARTIVWDTVHPYLFTSSRINHVVHRWYGKGYMVLNNEV